MFDRIHFNMELYWQISSVCFHLKVNCCSLGYRTLLVTFALVTDSNSLVICSEASFVFNGMKIPGLCWEIWFLMDTFLSLSFLLHRFQMQHYQILWKRCLVSPQNITNSLCLIFFTFFFKKKWAGTAGTLSKTAAGKNSASFPFVYECHFFFFTIECVLTLTNAVTSCLNEWKKINDVKH